MLNYWLACLRALCAHVLYVPTCLRAFASYVLSSFYVPYVSYFFLLPYVPSLFTCLTCLYFFTCLTFLRFICFLIFLRALRVLIFLCALRAFTFLYKMWNNIKATATNWNKQGRGRINQKQPKQAKATPGIIGELHLAKYPCEYFLVTPYCKRF